MLSFIRTNTLTVASNISGSGTLIQNGGGTILSGTNTYAGATTINAGMLTASGGSAIPDTSSVILANAASTSLGLNNSETIGSLSGGGTTGGNVTLGSNTLTIGGNNTSTSFDGLIQGAGGLTLAGTGTLTLLRANTYSAPPR